MPIPDRIPKHDGQFYIHAKWKLCWVLWPHHCEITGRKLWPGTQAYEGRAVYRSYVHLPWATPTMTLTETRWHGKEEHLIWQLKE
jgi:hypothetical protein